MDLSSTDLVAQGRTNVEGSYVYSSAQGIKENASASDPRAQELPSAISSTGFIANKTGNRTASRTSLQSVITSMSAVSRSVVPSVSFASNYTTRSWHAMLANASSSSPSNITASSNATQELINAWICYMNSGAWADASTSFASSHLEILSTSYPVQTAVCEANYTNTDSYTLCDGIPRFKGSGNKCSAATSFYTSTYTITTETYTTPAPSCSFATEFCTIFPLAGAPMPWSSPCATTTSQTFDCLVGFGALFWVIQC